MFNLKLGLTVRKYIYKSDNYKSIGCLAKGTKRVFKYMETHPSVCLLKIYYEACISIQTTWVKRNVW